MPLLKLKIYTFEKKIEFLDELPLAASITDTTQDFLTA